MVRPLLLQAGGNSHQDVVPVQEEHIKEGEVFLLCKVGKVFLRKDKILHLAPRNSCLAYSCMLDSLYVGPEPREQRHPPHVGERRGAPRRRKVQAQEAKLRRGQGAKVPAGLSQVNEAPE